MAISSRSPILALLAAGAVALAAAGCGSSDNSTSSSRSRTATSSASGSKLSAADARSLGDARQQVAEACRDKSSSPEGAVALISSLYEIDPSAVAPDGRSVRAVAQQARTQLQSCGQTSAAKELAKLK